MVWSRNVFEQFAIPSAKTGRKEAHEQRVSCYQRVEERSGRSPGPQPPPPGSPTFRTLVLSALVAAALSRAPSQDLLPPNWPLLPRGHSSRLLSPPLSRFPGETSLHSFKTTRLLPKRFPRSRQRRLHLLSSLPGSQGRKVPRSHGPSPKKRLGHKGAAETHLLRDPAWGKTASSPTQPARTVPYQAHKACGQTPV